LKLKKSLKDLEALKKRDDDDVKKSKIKIHEDLSRIKSIKRREGRTTDVTKV